MGKLYRIMRKAHRRKVRKAKERLRAYDAGKVQGEKLGALPQQLLRKRTRAKAGGRQPAAVVKPKAPPAAEQQSGGVA